MKRIIQQLLFLLCLTAILILPYFVFAENNVTTDPLENIKIVGSNYGPYSESTDETTFAMSLGTLVSVFLSLLGVFFISLMIYGGYHWMTARDKEERINKAKDTIKNAIIGLIITVSAWIIWGFIFDRLLF